MFGLCLVLEKTVRYVLSMVKLLVVEDRADHRNLITTPETITYYLLLLAILRTGGHEIYYINYGAMVSFLLCFVIQMHIDFSKFDHSSLSMIGSYWPLWRTAFGIGGWWYTSIWTTMGNRYHTQLWGIPLQTGLMIFSFSLFYWTMEADS